MSDELEKLDGFWCEKCKSLCSTYEQGLSCNCGPKWETEELHEQNYPTWWIPVEIIVRKKAEQ